MWHFQDEICTFRSKAFHFQNVSDFKKGFRTLKVKTHTTSTWLQCIQYINYGTFFYTQSKKYFLHLKIHKRKILSYNLFCDQS